MAETRPDTLDAMARIGGVGATKLERYGAQFLEVIAGEVQMPHPARRKLAGQASGAIYDRLLEAQADLARGEDGTGKPLSCTAGTLRWIAERRPDTREFLARAPGLNEPKLDRFGDAFLEIVRDTGPG